MSYAEFTTIYRQHVLDTLQRKLGTTQAVDAIYERAWKWYQAGKAAEYSVCWSLIYAVST
jgi:hypothetical protein